MTELCFDECLRRVKEAWSHRPLGEYALGYLQCALDGPEADWAESTIRLAALLARLHPILGRDYMPLVLFFTTKQGAMGACATAAMEARQNVSFGFGRKASYPAPILEVLVRALQRREVVEDAVRCLWIASREGVIFDAELLARLESLLEDELDHVRFFAAMALCWQSGCGDRERHLAAALEAEGEKLPDLSGTSRWGSYVDTFEARHPTPDEAKQSPTKSHQICGVCGGKHTGQVDHDISADNTGRWEVWVVLCTECGKVTCYEHDD